VSPAITQIKLLGIEKNTCCLVEAAAKTSLDLMNPVVMNRL